jgi:hypothetical protein
MTTLSLSSSNFEPVYGWLEPRKTAVEVWGLENGLRAALVAYSEGPGDDFGWSNWVRQAYDDPSEILQLFETLELTADVETTSGLSTAFPGVFATV